ncbi:MAG: hypothetical protein ABUK01_17280 [Leptospirales bacterium]
MSTNKQPTEPEQTREQKLAKIKKENKKIYAIVALLAIPYIAHVRISYGHWRFLDLTDPINVAIFAFVGLLLFMVWMTFSFFRQQL